jgi:hypothetical protein
MSASPERVKTKSQQRADLRTTLRSQTFLFHGQVLIQNLHHLNLVTRNSSLQRSIALPISQTHIIATKRCVNRIAINEDVLDDVFSLGDGKLIFHNFCLAGFGGDHIHNLEVEKEDLGKAIGSRSLGEREAYEGWIAKEYFSYERHHLVDWLRRGAARLVLCLGGKCCEGGGVFSSLLGHGRLGVELLEDLSRSERPDAV